MLNNAWFAFNYKSNKNIASSSMATWLMPYYNNSVTLINTNSTYKQERKDNMLGETKHRNSSFRSNNK